MPESSSETLAAAEVSSDAAALFGNELTADTYAKKLCDAGFFPDAIKYLAHALNARACIEWSLACLHSLGAGSEPVERDALQAIEQWLAEPTDAHRRACKAAAEEASSAGAAGCLATAVFFSEGSIAPPERDQVPVPPHVAQKVSAGALLLAIAAEPKEFAERSRRCVALFRKPA